MGCDGCWSVSLGVGERNLIIIDRSFYVRKARERNSSGVFQLVEERVLLDEMGRGCTSRMLVDESLREDNFGRVGWSAGGRNSSFSS